MSSLLRPEASLYRTNRCLGEGLSSRVFAAIREDSRGFSQQRVVLKILKTETDVRWLKQEFEALSRIKSSHCVQILGWENLPEGPALVLEEIDGLDLREISLRHAFSSAEVECIIAQIQMALSAVHSIGLCHGDLSLSNIMIDRNGKVCLIDFALSAPHITQVVGTPAYMAPEIWDGGKPSASADLFSLGLIREDLLSGTRESIHTRDACSKRIKLVLNSNSLLNDIPDERAMLKLMIEPSVQMSLGQIVDRIISDKLKVQTLPLKSESFTTQALGVKKSHGFGSRIAASLAGLVLMLPASVTHSKLSSSIERDACLEVRSSSWIEIAVDGRPRGFAPIKICNLARGIRTLSWKSASGAGQLKIKLGAGEERLVVDPQLKPIR